MKKFNSPQEALASQNFDPTAVKIEGVPEQHLEAVKSFINLCVGHDAVNPEFQPNYEDYSQMKYENYFELGSPAGVGFSFGGSADWLTGSLVGSRLVSESSDASRHVAELFKEDYKKMMVYQRKKKK